MKRARDPGPLFLEFRGRDKYRKKNLLRAWGAARASKVDDSRGMSLAYRDASLSWDGRLLEQVQTTRWNSCDRIQNVMAQDKIHDAVRARGIEVQQLTLPTLRVYWYYNNRGGPKFAYIKHSPFIARQTERAYSIIPLLLLMFHKLQYSRYGQLSQLP